MMRGDSGTTGTGSGQTRAWVPSRVAAVLAGLAACLVLAPGVLRAQVAQGAQDARCEAVLEGAPEDELLARIRGQILDVPCELVVGADQSGADAALAIKRADDGGYTLTVRVRADGAVHTRKVPAAAGDPNAALARSAAFEAVALVVRGELVELARASEARRQVEAERAAAAASAAAARSKADAKNPTAKAGADGADDRDDDDDSDEEDAGDADDEADEADGTPDGSPSAAGLRWQRASFALALGWELAATGMPEPAHALTGRALIALGPIELGLAGAFGFATKLDDAYVHAEVRRHAVLGVLALPLLRTSTFRVELSVLGGALLFVRQAEVRDPALIATRDTTSTAFVAGVEAAGELRLFGPLALRVALAVDVVPAAPRYAYELNGATHEGAPAWYVQPRGGVGLVVRLP